MILRANLIKKSRTATRMRYYLIRWECTGKSARAKNISARHKNIIARGVKNVARDKKILEPSNRPLEGSKIFLEGFLFLLSVSVIWRARAEVFSSAVKMGFCALFLSLTDHKIGQAEGKMLFFEDFCRWFGFLFIFLLIKPHYAGVCLLNY